MSGRYSKRCCSWCFSRNRESCDEQDDACWYHPSKIDQVIHRAGKYIRLLPSNKVPWAAAKRCPVISLVSKGGYYYPVGLDDNYARVFEALDVTQVYK